MQIFLSGFNHCIHCISNSGGTASMTANTLAAFVQVQHLELEGY